MGPDHTAVRDRSRLAILFIMPRWPVKGMFRLRERERERKGERFRFVH